jgi:hypothetical protein
MALTPFRPRRRPSLLVAALLLVAGSAPAQILPWEVVVAELEAGRLRNLAQRLSKQYVLYQLHLGGVRKSDLAETATEIDRVLELLQEGSPPHSIPAAWTPELRGQIQRLDGHWGPLRRIAIASPYELVRASQEFIPRESRRGDPLLVRYFDNLSLDFVEQSEKLLAIYDAECQKTGLQVCPTANTSGYAAMLMERALKEAVYVIAGIEAEQNRTRLQRSIDDYLKVRSSNDTNDFFAAALDPKRGISARAAGQLLLSLREDWDTMQTQFNILAAGDVENFDLQPLLAIQIRLVEKVERLTAALVRYASQVYGS